MLNADQVVTCFGQYMKHEGHAVSRARFEENLHGKTHDPEFMDDITPLLNPAMLYDSVQAMKLVRETLVDRIPGEPWRGEAR